MVSYSIQKVDRATDDQIEASAALFAQLMKHDLTILSLCGGDADLMPSMARSMVAACALDGEYYTATNENNELIAYAIWMPPGKALYSTEEQRHLGLNSFMEKLPDIGKEYYKTIYYVRFPQFVAKCLGSETWKADHWWLHSVMVKPEYQRQGIAKALIQLVRDKASRTGAPVALSTTTETNALIYTTLKFELKGNTMMPSPWGEWPIYVFRTGGPLHPAHNIL